MLGSRFFAVVSVSGLMLGALPALGQTYEVLGGARQIGDNDTRGYSSVTWRPAGMTAEGPQLRFAGTASTSKMFGTNVRQRTLAFTGGYAWTVGAAGNLALMAGPVYVKRTLDGLGDIDDVGVLVSAEYSGFVGDRGFAVAYTEYSSPDQALYARAFYSYYSTDQFGLGPDISYLNEPNFNRLTIGARGSYVIGSTVLSATIGRAITKNDFVASTDRSVFLELQFATSF